MSTPLTAEELHSKLANAMGWYVDEGMLIDQQKCPRTMGRWSERIEQAVCTAEELREAGRFRFWTITSPLGGGPCHALVNVSENWASIGRQGDTPAHALTLALLATLEATK